MRKLSLIVAVITLILLLSTLLCGLWIRSSGLSDDSSITFHMQIGITTIIAGLISAILLIVQSRKKQ